MDKIQQKATCVARCGVWALIFILNIALSLPGVIISLQYQNDDCVTKTSKMNVYLDTWLLIGSLYQFAIMFMILPCVCLHVRKRYIRVFLLISGIMQAAWTGMSAFLIFNSDLKSCAHDALWIMSTIFTVTLGMWLICQTLYAVIKIYRACRRKTNLFTPLVAHPDVVEQFLYEDESFVVNDEQSIVEQYL